MSGRPVVGLDMGGGRAWSLGGRDGGRTAGSKQSRSRQDSRTLPEQERRDIVAQGHLFRSWSTLGC